MQSESNFTALFPIVNEGHVALDIYLGYDTLLLRLITGDLLSACPHRQFHALPGLLDSLAAQPNSNPNALHAIQVGSLYHFYDGLWYDPAYRVRGRFYIVLIQQFSHSLIYKCNLKS